jgi:hypothetical protein
VGGIQTQLMSGLHLSLALNLNQNTVIDPVKKNIVTVQWDYKEEEPNKK